MSDTSAAAVLSAPPAAPAQEAAPQATTGVTSSATEAPQNAASSTSANEPWYKSFQDADARGFAEVRGWKSPEDTVKSFQNLEKLLGSKANAVMIPGEGATDEERAAFFEKIGRPGSPDNYAVPDALKEDATVKGFAAEAHKLGMTSSQFEGVMKFVAEQGAAQAATTNAQRDAAAEADMDALRKDNPGIKYDQLLEHGRRAVQSFGLDQPTLDKLESAMGTRGMLEFMAKIGASTAETPFIDGQRSGGAPSPEAARIEFEGIKKDQAFMKKWMAGDADAVARVNKLNAAMVVSR